jgi:hypothetical protein
MKRLGARLGAAFLASSIAGCTGAGIEEGMAKGQPSQEFQDDIDQMGKLMQTSKYGEKKAAAKVKQVMEQPKTGGAQPKTGP